MNSSRPLVRWTLLGLVLVCAVVALCGCAPDRTLAFEPIDQSTSARVMEPDPNLYIIAASKDLTSFQKQFQPRQELAEAIAALDYDDTVAVVIVRGHQGVTTPDLIPQTRQVIRRGNRVILDVHFGEVQPGGFVEMLQSNPYQAIAVTKEGWRGQRMRFVLEVDGEEVAERMHRVP